MVRLPCPCRREVGWECRHLTLLNYDVRMLYPSTTIIVAVCVMTLFGSVIPALAQDIVAHRGASGEAPENTLAAFRLAWKQGADAIEGDFFLTKDGRIVCIHDKDTERTAGRKLIVAESTLQELRQLEYGKWKHEKFEGEPIPTLEQVLDTVPEGKYILIEIKCGPEIVPVLKKILDETDLERDQLRIICFNDEVVAASKQAMPDIKTFWLTSFKQDKITGRWKPKMASILKTLKRTNADGLDCKGELKVLTPAFVKQLRDQDYEFHTWTINEPDHAMKLKALGVDSITTDYPAKIRKVIDSDEETAEADG